MSASRTPARELVLRPETAVSWQDFADAWEYRELLWMLALRDVKVRYKQASLGIAWALLQPLTQMAIFTVLFNRFAGIRGDVGVPYPVFCFAGLIVWTVFASGLAHASDSLINSAALVTKVYFPRVIVPLASILTTLVDSAVAMMLLVVLMIGTGVPLHWSGLLAIPIAGIAALCAAAVGLWTSALNLQYRDVRHALPFFIQLLIYTTPVFYSASLVPERYRALLALNPMAAVVNAFRAALFGTEIPYAQLGVALVATLMIGFVGFLKFRQLERTFADRI